MTAPPSEPDQCPDCGARIWRAYSSAGALSPFDTEPVPDGTWLLTFQPERGPAGELVCEYAGAPERQAQARAEGRNLYRTHYATCRGKAREGDDTDLDEPEPLHAASG